MNSQNTAKRKAAWYYNYLIMTS